MTQQVWSLADHTFSYGGLSTDPTDIDKEGTIKVEASSKSFSMTEGFHGACINKLNPNPPCKITLKVRQCSPYNTKLSAALALALLGPAGLGIAPLYVKDGGGSMLLLETSAQIESMPDDTIGSEESTVEWVFLCPAPNRFQGGH
jgi:hypothetical protein